MRRKEKEYICENCGKQLYEFINDMPIRSEADMETFGTFND